MNFSLIAVTILLSGITLLTIVNAEILTRTRKKELYYHKNSIIGPESQLESNPTFYNDRCKGLEALLSSDECKFDPDTNLDVPQIIRRHGYPSETHVIETEDGYLLKVHRIPGNTMGVKGGQPIFLQHGLLGSSADWILNGNNTLAFYLADNNYDVWLGNARGNVYSRAHVSLPLHSAQFWNFSWHEMGTKDLPAVLYHISNTTGKPGQIIYIGHSMGTTMSFVLLSSLPQVAKNLKLVVSLAPTAFMTHLTSPIRRLVPFVNDANWILRNLGINSVAPTNKVIHLLSYGCEKKPVKEICENLVFLFAGFNEKEFDVSVLPSVLAHDPAGSSTKSVLHYAQEIKSGGNFQQFDYGREGNMEKYGTPTPPMYDLSNIKRPVYLMYATNDILSSYLDVERFAKNVTSLVGMYKVPSKTFGHLDFILGKNAFEYIYKPLLKFLKNFEMEMNVNNV